MDALLHCHTRLWNPPHDGWHPGCGWVRPPKTHTESPDHCARGEVKYAAFGTTNICGWRGGVFRWNVRIHAKAMKVYVGRSTHARKGSALPTDHPSRHDISLKNTSGLADLKYAYCKNQTWEMADGHPFQGHEESKRFPSQQIFSNKGYGSAQMDGLRQRR